MSQADEAIRWDFKTSQLQMPKTIMTRLMCGCLFLALGGDQFNAAYFCPEHVPEIMKEQQK